ncbi:hypothetical protein [Jatrophihabitans fulvus]
MTVVVLVVACLSPALAFWLFSRAFDWFSTYERRVPTPKPDPAVVLPRIGDDLRRLSAEHRWLMRADVPGRALRIKAVELAYDDVLLQAGAVLEIDLPEPPLAPATRLEAEMELATHGFTW